MPEPTPPAVPATGVAPTPAGEYKLSEHVPSPVANRNPELAAALAKRAGTAPQRQESSQPQRLPSEPPKPPAEPVVKPEPEPKLTRFVPADEREPEIKVEKTTPETPRVAGEPSPEQLKSAPAQLREAYEKLKSDFASRAAEGEMTKKQLAEFQSKAKSYEDRIKTLESAEHRAKELEKQVLTYDEQLRVTNYIQHPEFHEKFVKPVAEAVQSGNALVKELMVTDPESGENRYGTDADFGEIVSQPNHALMDKKAVELFGERMSIHVVEAAKKVRELHQAQAKAVKEAGLRSQEWLKQQQERAAAARTTARTEFDKAAQALEAKYPEIYKPAEGDKEAIAARKAGDELARLVVEGQPEGMPDSDYLNAVAKVYQRAASFPMRELAITRLQKELDETKAKLAAYEKSTPDANSRKQPGGVTTDAGGTVVTSNDALRAQMRASLERRAGTRR